MSYDAYLRLKNMSDSFSNTQSPQFAVIQKPYHTSRASLLFSAASQGMMSKPECLETTFALVVYFSDHKFPLVVSIDEDYGQLLDDIRRIAKKPEIQKLSACTTGGSKDHGIWELDGYNVEPLLRFMKSRQGGDSIRAT